MNENKPKIKFEEFSGATPVLPCVWPRIQRPQTKFNPDGTFSIGVLFDPNEESTKRLLKRIDATFKSACDAVAAQLGPKKQFRKSDPPYKPYLDKDDNDTGLIQLNFKRQAIYMKDDEKIKVRIPFFDSMARPITDDVNMGGGSTVKVRFNCRGYYVPAIGVGVSLRLEAVQVFNLKHSFDKNDPTSYGFSAEEAADGDTMGGEEGEGIEATTTSNTSKVAAGDGDY